MTRSTTELRNHAWFALADAETCRLLLCSLTEQGTQHVEEYDATKNTRPEQEHIRPMTNGGETHHVEDKERRFAAEIIGWLQKKAIQREIDHLVIFAPARMLGVLRQVPLGALKGHVDELKGDLVGLHVGQLANHPMVRELLGASASISAHEANDRRSERSKGQRKRHEEAATGGTDQEFNQSVDELTRE